MQVLARTFLVAAMAVGTAAEPAWAQDAIEDGVPVPTTVEALAPVSELVAPDWIVKASDNVCGLTNARQISKPASVDYDALIDITPEMKEMKRKGITKDSPEGHVLHNKAIDRVRNAAHKVMLAKGYDSVWKKIRHRRGKSVPGITDAVRAEIKK